MCNLGGGSHPHGYAQIQLWLLFSSGREKDIDASLNANGAAFLKDLFKGISVFFSSTESVFFLFKVTQQQSTDIKNLLELNHLMSQNEKIVSSGFTSAS